MPFMPQPLQRPLSPVSESFGGLVYFASLNNRKYFPSKGFFVPHLFSKIENLILLLSPLEKIREEWPKVLALIDLAVGIGVEDLFLRSMEPWSRSHVL
jgi:hypothetical protein